MQKFFPETSHNIVEKYGCFSDQKDYMFNDSTECENCNKVQLYGPNTVDDMLWIQIRVQMLMATRFHYTDGKHQISMSLKYTLVYPLKKLWMFKKSVATLKTHIYSLKAQNRTYNEIKESVDHGEILVHVDYAELCKNS